MLEKKIIKQSLYALLSLLIIYSLLVLNAFSVNAEDDPAEDINNPYRFRYFAEEYLNETITVNTKGKVAPVDESKITSGLLFSGKAEKFNGSSITFVENMEFSSGDTTKMRVEGLSKVGAKVLADFYLDDEDVPFVSVQLKPQAKEDDWANTKYTFVELDQTKMIGSRKISVKLRDTNTLADDKTAAVIKSIKFYKENVPTVYIDIDESLGTIADMNGSIDHDVNCYGDMTIKTPAGFQSDYLDTPAAETTTVTYPMEYIRGRGNSTWGTKKKPYKIKLKEEADLFGMGANKHWALIANYYDGTLLRNRITYFMAAAMGMDYTPQLIPVDVVMNGNYLGSYYLSEVVRIGESRVDIHDLEKGPGEGGNITGGYMLGMTPYGKDQGYKFKTVHDVKFLVESPEEVKGDDENQTQLNAMNKYIDDYINKTEAAIFGEGFKDGNGISYKEYLDTNAAAKYFLVQSVTHNNDAYGTPSTKLYKPENGKLCFGPLWDFDFVAWNYADENATPEQESDPDKDITYKDFHNSFCWFDRLLEDPDFYQEVMDAWFGKGEGDTQAMRYQLYELAKDGGVIDRYANQLLYSVESNYDISGNSQYSVIGIPAQDDDERWHPFGSGEYENGDGFAIDDDYALDEETEEVFAEEIIKYTNKNEYLNEVRKQKEWILKRIAWVDENLADINIDTRNRFTLSFYDGDELYATRVVIESDYLKDFPEEPVKEGYYFDGWYGEMPVYNYETDEYELKYAEFKEETYPMGDMKLEAKWISKSEIVHAKEIHFAMKDIYLCHGDSFKLNYTILPAEAAENKVKITSSNPEMLNTQNDGIINVMYEEYGDATVTVTTMDGVSGSVNVHICREEDLGYLEDIAVSEEEVTLKKGETKGVTLSFVPEDVRYRDYKIISADADVATMTNAGMIHAKKAGITTILVYVEGLESYRTIKVRVTDPSVNPEPVPEDDSLSFKKLKKGTVFAKGKLVYEVVEECKMSDGKIIFGSVQVKGFKKAAKKKTATVIIPASVTSQYNTFKVVGIKSKAFYGEKKLKKITIKSTTLKTVGKNAFKGINKKAKIKVPASKLKAYKKLLKKKGQKKTVKITK